MKTIVDNRLWVSNPAELEHRYTLSGDPGTVYDNTHDDENDFDFNERFAKLKAELEAQLKGDATEQGYSEN